MPLQYPPLLYLLGRALWIGLRGGGRASARSGRRPGCWIAALFLMGFRVGLNMADSGAIDVGYAGVVGADRITHGEPIYDNFPDDVSQGDTYGPVNYLAYVPFELIWPWSGSWDDLPAAHGAAVFFDLATFALLILLGIRIRPGPPGNARRHPRLRLGRLPLHRLRPAVELQRLAGGSCCWSATLLVLAQARWPRGVCSPLATLAKFAPAVLVPMLLTYRPAGEAATPGRCSRGPVPAAPPAAATFFLL